MLFSKIRIAKFWGASDDILCCSGIKGENDEFSIESHPKLHENGYVGTFELSSPDNKQGLFVHAFYSGHWSFAISPSNIDIDELPEWNICREWGTINSHSETVLIECPRNVTFKVIDRMG